MTIAAALLALCACQDQTATPPPGAEGPVIIRQWNADGEPPIAVLAQSVQQRDSRFRRLDLQPVLARVPFEDGVIFIAAPKATYDNAGSDNSVALEGPVKLVGTYRNEPWIGRADRALIDPVKRTLIFYNNEWYYKGGVHHSKEAVVDQMQILSSTHITNSPAAVICALYALPQPLYSPELKR